jgi:hypothetical protein
VRKSIQEKKKAGELPSGGQKARPAKRNRWDKMEEEPPKKKSAWDQADVSFQ